MTASLGNARFAQTLVDTLVAGGLSHAVISPGSRNTPLVLACDAALRGRTHVVLDERAAAFVALGLARLSDAPVALVCTSGSAAAHYLPAIVEAHYDGLPLVVLSADRPTELHHCGAGQTIEQAHLFGRYARWFAALDASHAGDAGAAATAGLRAIAEAAHGPVHLDVAFREPLWAPGDVYTSDPARAPRLLRSTRRVDDEGVAALARRLEQHERGVIVCGPRTARQSGPMARAVGALAERLGWPVLADAASGVRFAEATTASTIAGYDPLLRDARFAAETATCVLRFGQLPASKALTTWLAAVPREHTVVVGEGGEPQDPSHQLGTWIVTDPIALADGLARAVRTAPERPWLRRWRRAEQAAQRALAAECTDAAWEGAIARALAEALPAGALLHVASSMPVRDLEAFAPVLARDVVVTCNRGANGIDGTIATLAGQALAWRRGPVVALLGDLAYLHDHAALVTARELGVGMTLVVVNNHGGGIFDFLPVSGHPEAFERYFRTPHHADLGALARGAGFVHERLDDLASLRTALAALEPATARVLEVRAPNDNVARHNNAWARVARALTETT